MTMLNYKFFLSSLQISRESEQHEKYLFSHLDLIIKYIKWNHKKFSLSLTFERILLELILIFLGIVDGINFPA